MTAHLSAAAAAADSDEAIVSRDQYVALVRDLLSGDPERIRDANRTLFGAVVSEAPREDDAALRREADLALAEAAE